MGRRDLVVDSPFLKTLKYVDVLSILEIRFSSDDENITLSLLPPVADPDLAPLLHLVDHVSSPTPR